MQLALTPSRQTSLPPPIPKPRLDESRIGGCEYLHYPWDDWERWAIAQGLNHDLAALARLTIREAYQHNWDERLKSLCGWRDDGQRMLRFALRCPSKARYRWNRLLETDGYRGEYDQQTGQWISYR
jgi:hypothetical protein